MLSASYTTSKTDSTVDQTTLQLMVDDLLCGRQVYSIDKKYHLLLLPYLQKAKNEAINNQNQALELKIDRIVNLLTLSTPKRTPTKKQQLTPKKSKTSPSITNKTATPKDYSQYNEEVDQLMNHKKTFKEIESKNFTPIQLCIQQHRDEASKSQDYQVAKKYHSEYLSFSNYIRTLPKRKRHYGDEEYIDRLKYKYCQALQYYQDLEERLNNESDQLDQSEQQITMATLSAIQEEDDKFDQEETDIINCKDYHPSSFLLNLRKTEKKCAKIFLYDEADMRLKYGNELENIEKSNYITNKRYELADKKLRAKIDRQKQNELNDDKNATKNELFQLKRNRLLRIAQAEIDKIKVKIEELGDHVPEGNDLILYSLSPENSPKKKKNNPRLSQSDSNINTQEVYTPTEDSLADFSISQRSSSQNINPNQNANNYNLSSEGSASINLDDNPQELRRNFNPSKIVLIGTPNSRSIADLTLIRKDNNQNDDTENQQNKILRDRSNDYEFVFDENEEEDYRNAIPINKGQIESSQKSILAKNKEKPTKSRSIIINKTANNNIINSNNNNDEEDSVYLSDSTEFDHHPKEEDDTKKRVSLQYKKFLTPNQDLNKKPRNKLDYDKYLRSPKPKIIKYTNNNNNNNISNSNYYYSSDNNTQLSDTSYHYTSNDYSSQKFESSSATEIIYSSVSERTNSNYYQSEYSNYYYSEEEEEEEEEEERITKIEISNNFEYSYNNITEDELNSYG